MSLIALQTTKYTHQLRKVLAIGETSHGIYQLETSHMSFREEREAHLLSPNDYNPQ